MDLGLTNLHMCCILCVMKTVNIREAQHNLSNVLKRVEGGEEIEVLRRRTPVARIVPISPKKSAVGNVDWSNVPERLERIWGGSSAPGRSTDSILNDLRGER